MDTAGALPFQPLDARRAQALASSRWQFVSPEQKSLAPLQGAILDGYRLLALAGGKNGVGALYFQIYLVSEDGSISEGPLALGLRNTGPYPGFNWIELIDYEPVVRIDGNTVDLRGTPEEQRLFQLFGEMLPPGGHIMVEYDSPAQAETARILSAGLPAPCSPVGYALLQAGCLNFRDWYIPEGGSEGPRKLQGFKPLDDSAAYERWSRLQDALAETLAKLPDAGEPWQATARRLAGLSLQTLHPSDD